MSTLARRLAALEGHFQPAAVAPSWLADFDYAAYRAAYEAAAAMTVEELAAACARALHAPAPPEATERGFDWRGFVREWYRLTAGSPADFDALVAAADATRAREED